MTKTDTSKIGQEHDLSYQEKVDLRSSMDSMKGGSIRVPITLTWEDVSFTVDVPTRRCPPWSRKKQKKRILRDISGYVKPGQMLAIMGSTGAGKSSLLDVLADRKSTGIVKGNILLNGRKPDKLFKRLTSYVTQDDALPGFYTVRETLQFYADLKLPSSVTKEQKRQRVNSVLEELGLEKVADSRVGTQFQRGISGGEKKRLSIGSQLITDPVCFNKFKFLFKIEKITKFYFF